jgi:hypothetical protein
MTEVNIPHNYDSIESLHKWLLDNFWQHSGERWWIITYPGRGYCIRFTNQHDAMMFSLKWKYD